MVTRRQFFEFFGDDGRLRSKQLLPMAFAFIEKDEFECMAREAGFDPHDMSDDCTCNLVDIERFAALVAAHERRRVRRCVMCLLYILNMRQTLQKVAAQAIRARG